MKLRVERITEEEQERDFSEPVEDANQRLDSGAHDFRLIAPLAGTLTYYRVGADLVLGGRVRTRVEGTCARCLEAFPLDLEVPFDVVLTPPSAAEHGAELRSEDLALATYEGDEIDLAPLIEEQ